MVKRYTVPEYSVLYHEGDGLLVEYKDYAALEDRIAELERDAARYRWLAGDRCVYDVPSDDVGPWLYHGTPWNCNWRIELDDAIDEAMSRET